MINYETLMLARTEITDDEVRALEGQLDKISASCKGKLTVFDKWGKYKLAYPVKKNVYGIYMLARYQVPSNMVESFFKEIDTLFRLKYNELVMRHVNVRLADDVSSIYKYPEAVAAHGRSNLNSFLKEHKMEGLIDTPVDKKPKEEKKEKEEVVKQSVEAPESTEPIAETSESGSTKASPFAKATEDRTPDANAEETKTETPEPEEE